LTTQEFIAAALPEDVGSGDYSTLASIPADAKGMAVLKIKEEGIPAGMRNNRSLKIEIETRNLDTEGLSDL